jgi:tetratricopeptide (TPR) repeat protein
MNTRPLSRAAAFAVAIALCTPGLHAADQWIEVKSPHFVVTSNAGQSSAKSVAWQLEQIRSAIAVWWSWARVDLNKPMAVLAVKDEATMKTLAPEYWEEKGRVHPSSVWVTGPDQHYVAIRTDVEAEDRYNINPYFASYFSYVSLILQQSVDRDLPLWFSRGLSGVMSNTLVHQDEIVVGAPIPWHLERLRERERLPLATLVKVTRDSPEFRTDERMARFDAQSWALVHFLLFGDKGARAANLGRFVTLVATGTDPDAAFREALGGVEQLDGPLATYMTRSLFSFRKLDVDASTKREGFTVRSLAPADAAAARALFHAAMDRPVDARAAIAEARKTAVDAPDGFLAEALLLDREGKRDEATAAFTRAVDAGSTSPYAPYRLAMLLWQPQMDHETLVRIEKLLGQAISSNKRNAAAYARFGEIRAILGSGEPVPYVVQAITLEPGEPSHRMAAARVLWRQKKYGDALKQAQIAAALARTEEERRDATQMIAAIEEAQRRAANFD